MHEYEQSFLGRIAKSMGLVFGDIGTSSIYTLSVIFATTNPTQDNAQTEGRLPKKAN